VRRERFIALLVLASILPGAAGGAHAFDLFSRLDLLGQVREGDQSRKTEAPADVYGQVGASGLWARSSVDTFFRLERDLANDDGDTDFYAGYATIPGAVPGVEATAGRQFLSEGPGFTYIADAGKIRIDRGWPVAFTVYGGAPQYFEPTYSTTVISQDETLWGGNARSRRWKGGQLGAGYQQWERKGRVLQQLVTATGTQALPRLPVPTDLYGSIAYDAGGNNLDFASAGANLTVPAPRLLVNLEGTYYKPQDGGKRVQTDLKRREDTIFQAFSVSDLTQFRTGLTIPFGRALSARGAYSYQRYDSLSGNGETGHLGSAGLMWLPGGDGLETIGLDYYVADSGGNVNGGSASYQNQVYEQITFFVRFGVASYEKRSNQDGTAITSFLGLTYDVLPELSCQVNFEANHNERFDEDFRFGFRVAYNFRHRIERSAPAGERS
jgi:hypothetical protein